MVNLSNGPPPIVKIFFQNHPNHNKLLEISISTIKLSTVSFIVDTCYRGYKFKMTNYVHNIEKNEDCTFRISCFSDLFQDTPNNFV